MEREIDRERDGDQINEIGLGWVKIEIGLRWISLGWIWYYRGWV